MSLYGPVGEPKTLDWRQTLLSVRLPPKPVHMRLQVPKAVQHYNRLAQICLSRACTTDGASIPAKAVCR